MIDLSPIPRGSRRELALVLRALLLAPEGESSRVDELEFNLTHANYGLELDVRAWNESVRFAFETIDDDEGETLDSLVLEEWDEIRGFAEVLER